MVDFGRIYGRDLPTIYNVRSPTDYISFMTLLKGNWDYERYQQNSRVLARAKFPTTHNTDIYSILYIQTAIRLKNIAQFIDERLPYMPRYIGSAFTLQELMPHQRDINRNDIYVQMSNDHSTTYYLLKKNEEEARRSKSVGLVVIDRHVDIYGLPKKGHPPSKEKFLAHVLQEDLAVAVGVIGLPEENYLSFSFGDLGTFKHRMGQRLTIITDPSTTFSTPRRKHFTNGVLEILERMKNLGVENIIISLDLDVLRQ